MILSLKVEASEKKTWLERLLKNEAAGSVCGAMHMLYEDICVFQTNDEEGNEQFLFLSSLQWYVTNRLAVYCERMHSYALRLSVDTFLINYAVAIFFYSCRISQTHFQSILQTKWVKSQAFRFMKIGCNHFKIQFIRDFETKMARPSELKVNLECSERDDFQWKWMLTHGIQMTSFFPISQINQLESDTKNERGTFYDPYFIFIGFQHIFWLGWMIFLAIALSLSRYHY